MRAAHSEHAAAAAKEVPEHHRRHAELKAKHSRNEGEEHEMGRLAKRIAAENAPAEPTEGADA